MAFDETFRPYAKFEETEVFALTGQAREVRELHPSNFEGPVADWANQRMDDLGETIVPRHVYIERIQSQPPHRVAWVYHDGFDMDRGQPFCLHHVACDCSSEVDRSSNTEEKQEIMSNCPALMNVLSKRAWLVNSTYGMDAIFSQFYDPEKPAEEQSSEAQHFAIRSMMYMLEHDYRHPESWVANVESGWNLINLMARVMQLRAEDVQWYAELLATQEMVETDGVVISLTQAIKDKIDAEKLLREVAENAAKSFAA